MKLRKLGVGILALASMAMTTSASTLAASSACDRACLEGFVDRFLDAMIAHDPSRAPLAKNVKFTENGQHLDLGDGMWRTLSAKGEFRLIVADEPSGHVAFLGSILEDGIPAMLALHLKVAKQKIAAAEMLVQRNEKAAQGFDKIGYRWTEAAPANERMSHDDLVRVANMYFSGLENNDGKGVYPFTDDCNRIENGVFTTNTAPAEGQTRPDPKTSDRYSANWGCREQFESGLIHFVTRIRDRRFVAVDVERGIAFAFGFFDHAAGATRTFQTPSGRTVTAGPRQPWTWHIAEAFQIRGGKIHQIQAIMERVPYGMLSGWSTREQGMSSEARDVTKH